MTILYTTKKGRMLNTIEKYYIYAERQNDNQLNDGLTVTSNIFDTIFRNMTPTAARP
jgi:hypothetical protein